MLTEPRGTARLAVRELAVARKAHLRHNLDCVFGRLLGSLVRNGLGGGGQWVPEPRAQGGVAKAAAGSGVGGKGFWVESGAPQPSSEVRESP